MSTRTNLKKKDIESDRLLQQRNRYNRLVMFSGFISKIGKGLLLFVKEGATVDGNYYLKMLKKHFYVIRRLFGGQKFTIQQDSTFRPMADAIRKVIEEGGGHIEHLS